jgi:hypothetical protein
VKRARLLCPFKPFPSKSALPPYKTSILRPVANVRLLNGRAGTGRIDALIDSGCAITMFNSAFAEQLKIDRSACKKHQCSGLWDGGVVATIHKLKLMYRHFWYETDVLFVDNLPVPGLLGLHGFFDRFRCRIHAGRWVTELDFLHERREVQLLGGQPESPEILLS